MAYDVERCSELLEIIRTFSRLIHGHHNGLICWPLSIQDRPPPISSVFNPDIVKCEALGLHGVYELLISHEGHIVPLHPADAGSGDSQLLKPRPF